MNWLDKLLDFLAAFIPAAWKSYFATMLRRQTDANSGAADQREADDAADDKITAEARGRAEKTAGETDDEIFDDLRDWRGPRDGRV